MTSTPSASALSAVLRCRRNIWTSPSARLTGSTARDSLPVKTASFWEAFTDGERLVLGRLALTCNVPWKKKTAERVCHKLSQSAHAHGGGHARKPTPPAVSPRPTLLRPPLQAKVVFVCETSGALKVSVCPRGLDTADRKCSWLWVSLRSSCVSLTSLLSHFMLDKLLVLFRSHRNQEDEYTSLSNDLEINRPADLCSDDAGVCGTRITEDRPD